MSKFTSKRDEAVYELSRAGADEYLTRDDWKDNASLLIGDLEPSATMRLDLGLTPTDCFKLKVTAAVIVYEEVSGDVTVEYYADVDRARRRWSHFETYVFPSVDDDDDI